jgi:type IV pilus assembly protein PilV
VGLQAAMTKAQGSAKSRADASMLANELVGLMWSDYSNMITNVNFANYNTSISTVCTVDPCSSWASKVTSALPNGSAQVIATNLGGTTTEKPPIVSVNITISWTVPGEGNHQYVTSTTIQ